MLPYYILQCLLTDDTSIARKDLIITMAHSMMTPKEMMIANVTKVSETDNSEDGPWKQTGLVT
jgi:hypothetical protein